MTMTDTPVDEAPMGRVRIVCDTCGEDLGEALAKQVGDQWLYVWPETAVEHARREHGVDL